MSNGTFVLVLAAGAALIAAWCHVRFPSLAPERLGRTVLHLAIAVVAISLAPNAASSHSAFVALFAVMLPVLVYAFLSTIWMLRLAQTALGVR